MKEPGQLLLDLRMARSISATDPSLILPTPKDVSNKSRTSGFVEFAKANPAIVLTLFYVLLTFMGMEYSWALYGEFDLNYFDFASADDFLLSAFKDPFMLGSSLIWLLSSLFFFSRYLSHRPVIVARNVRVESGWFGSKYFMLIAAAFYIGFTPLWIAYVSGFQATQIKSGNAHSFLVEFSAPNTDPHRHRYSIIGTTSGYMVLYDPAQDEPLVVSKAQVRWLALCPETWLLPVHAVEARPQQRVACRFESLRHGRQYGSPGTEGEHGR